MVFEGDSLKDYILDFKNEELVKVELPNVEERKDKSWIPVSERLPEEGKMVLAYYEYFRYGDYNRMWPTYGVGYQYDGLWCGDISGHKLNVIAWMPFPDYERRKM